MNFNFSKNFNRGFLDITMVFIIVVIALAAFLAAGSSTKIPTNPGQTYEVEIPTPDQDRKSLQLNTLKFKKVELPKGNACEASRFNREADIFVGSDPAPGGAAPAGGRIRVWIDDGNGGSVASGEVIDQNTGQIITPGDRNATDGKGPGYYLYEPALYITLLTSPDQPGPFAGDAENGGKPYFPTAVRGEVVYEDSDSTDFLPLPPVESPVGFDIRTRRSHGGHIAQFTWDVNSLALSPGFYRAQFVVHDGDGDVAINCITIQI